MPGEKLRQRTKKVLEPVDDVAAVILGNGWRMPTKEEAEELCDQRLCAAISTIDSFTSARGYTFVSLITGNRIFLPNGSQYGTEERLYKASGIYWTSSVVDIREGYNKEYEEYVRAYSLWLANNSGSIIDHDRGWGGLIRPVHE